MHFPASLSFVFIVILIIIFLVILVDGQRNKKKSKKSKSGQSIHPNGHNCFYCYLLKNEFPSNKDKIKFNKKS